MGKRLRYNKVCPAHEHTCWGHRHLMREDDVICLTDYRRLPKELINKLWDVKKGRSPVGEVTIIINWLIANPLQEDVECSS